MKFSAGHGIALMIRNHQSLFKRVRVTQQAQNIGFGITEVMVASSLTLVVGATTMNMMMSQMLWQAKQVLRQDAVDQLDLARVQFRSSQNVNLKQIAHCDLTYLEESIDGSWIHAESSCNKGKLNATVKGYLTRAEQLPETRSEESDNTNAASGGSGSGGLNMVPLYGGRSTSTNLDDSDYEDGDSDSLVGHADSDDGDSDESNSDLKSSKSCSSWERYFRKC
jgi:hypothetical protein